MHEHAMVLEEERHRRNFSLVRYGLQARLGFLQRRQPALFAAEGRDKPADVGMVGWNDMDERLSHHPKTSRAYNLTFVRIFWCFHAAVSSFGATAHYLRRWPMVSIFLWPPCHFRFWHLTVMVDLADDVRS